VRKIKIMATLIFSILCLIFFSGCGRDGGRDLVSAVPDALTVGEESLLREDCVTNAGSGIYYNTELFVFYPVDKKIMYKKFSNNSWGKEKDFGGEYTDYAVSPVIFKNRLFVFWVGTDGHLNHKIYNGADQEGNDQWVGKYTFTHYPQGEVAPVYNPELDRLEVYYRGGDGSIRYIYTNHINDIEGRTWSPEGNNVSDFVPGLWTGSAPSAEIVETGKDENGKDHYKVMLAHRSYDNNKIHIDFLKNGQLENGSGYSLEGVTTLNPPHLVNLGNGRIALLWRGIDNRIYLMHYDEDSKKWDNPQYLEKETNIFHVRGAAFYVPHKYTIGEGENKKEVIDLEGYLMVFWVYKETVPHYLSGEVFYNDYNRLRASQAEYLGEWKKDTEATTKKNWAELKDYSIFPVVGVIDMPPFAFNGRNVKSNSTTVSFAENTANYTKMSWTFKLGSYYKISGKQVIPIEAEAHVGLSEAIGTSKTVEQSIEYTFGAGAFFPYEIIPPFSIEDYPQSVTVLYMAPFTEVWKYIYYRPDGTRTDKEMYMVNVTNASILQKSVKLENFLEQFPKHKAGDLTTYNYDYTRGGVYDSLEESATWSQSVASKLKFVEQSSDEKSSGSYISFKIGENLGYLGTGVEGSFNVDVTQRITVTDSLQTIFNNPVPRDPNSDPDAINDIYSFGVTAFWLRPNKDGYWVPKDRIEKGDTPWFITYRVYDYQLVGGELSKVSELYKIPAVKNGGPEYFEIDGIKRPTDDDDDQPIEPPGGDDQPDQPSSIYRLK
jgi:hypothetical protein